MEDLFTNLTPAEQLNLKLRRLFELYGYKEYRMGKFEPYDFYKDHKSFLSSENIVSFTDSGGRLMALKPDVTLSIVKNVKEDAVSEKLYYMENVFRIDPASKECRELKQIGVEYIGGKDKYSSVEIALLALKSLREVSPNSILNISHMGFLTGFLSHCGFGNIARDKILKEIKQKNIPEITSFARKNELPYNLAAELLTISNMPGSFRDGVDIAEALSKNEEMKSAVEELKEIYRAVEALGLSQYVRLDFAVAGDMDYYNGIVLQGYIKEVGKAILVGGRYDNLMKRCGKPQAAIGFALNLMDLNRIFGKRQKSDIDILLIYGDAQPGEVAAAIEGYIAMGLTVRAEKENDGTIKAKNIFILGKDEI